MRDTAPDQRIRVHSHPYSQRADETRDPLDGGADAGGPEGACGIGVSMAAAIRVAGHSREG